MRSYLVNEKSKIISATSIIMRPPSAGIPKDAIMNISTQAAPRGRTGTKHHKNFVNVHIAMSEGFTGQERTGTEALISTR